MDVGLHFLFVFFNFWISASTSETSDCRYSAFTGFFSITSLLNSAETVMTDERQRVRKPNPKAEDVTLQ